MNQVAWMVSSSRFIFPKICSPSYNITDKRHHASNIMTHIVSAALAHLKKDFAKDDGEEGWESYPNLRALADSLESKELGHWGNADFDPEFVATSLYPHKVTDGDIESKMTNYAELNEGEFTRLHKNLLSEKGSDYQRDFLVAVKDSEDFLSFMDKEVSKTLW